MSRQEAYRRFSDCQLLVDESVDVYMDDPKSPRELVIIGDSAPAKSTLGVLVAAGRLSSLKMLVITAMVNGQSVLCLVDTGSGCTLVSTRVVVGPLGRKACHVVTANGRTSNSGRGCWASVELQGHSFKVHAIAQDGFENLGVDCLLGDDVVDHMGGVTIRRGTDSRYLVSWGKPNATSCQKGSSQLSGRQICGGVAPLTISDKEFDAVFAHGHWTVCWRWIAGEPKQLQSRIGRHKFTRAQGVHEKYTKEVQS